MRVLLLVVFNMSMYVVILITDNNSVKMACLMSALMAIGAYFWIPRKPKYKRLELRRVTWAEGDRMLKENEGKPEAEQWHLAKEEDDNHQIGWVYLERRVRVG